ncbi:MAG: hypothetical protein IPJ11_13815 [Gemmatimonadetes bacterium]|nr:hypothetical protein [Gemmatimonadota bacterium]
MTHSLRLLMAISLAALPHRGASPFANDRHAPLRVADSLWKQQDGVEIRAIRFDSPKGGRVTGLLFLPGNGGRHPGILLGHGAPGDSRSERAVEMGVALARAGTVVLAIDAPFARRGDAPVTFTPSDSADQVQLVIDSRRGLDLLVARPDIDPSRLGYVGTSYGGAQGALLVGVEPRLRAAVLRVADGGFTAHFSDPCDPAAQAGATIRGCLIWTLPEGGPSEAERERWAAAMRPIEPIEYIGRARARILFQSGRQDASVLPVRAARLHQAAPAGSVVEWYDSGHRLPAEATASALSFLARALGTLAPAAASSR